MDFAAAQQIVRSEAKIGILVGLLIFFVAIAGALHKFVSSHNKERRVKTIDDEVKEVLNS